jgi:hypothetical protein
MSYFEAPAARPTDLASRVGGVIGNILVVLSYLLIIYPVARSFLK